MLKDTPFIVPFFAAFLLTFSVFPVAAENNPPGFQGRQFPFTILKPPQVAPGAPLYTLKGGVTTLRRYRGQVVLLNVWATWCAACLYEMPSLDRLQAKLGGDGFSVVSLSVDEGGARKVLSYLERLKIKNLPQYLDPAGRTAAALGVGGGLPWTFLINPQGLIMGYMKGAADWESPAARKLIEYYGGKFPR